MRITLYNPITAYESSTRVALPPLGLMAIAKECQDLGHRVTVVDANLGLSNEGLDAVIRSDPDIIAATSWLGGMPPLRALKKISQDYFSKKRIPIVVGGAFPTVEPRFHLNEGADLVMMGDGRRAFRRFLRDPSPFAGVGIFDVTYITDGWMHTSGLGRMEEPIGCLASVFPLFPIKEYAKRWSEGPGMMLIGATGCTHQCAFCSSQYLGSHQPRHENALHQEAKALREQYGIERIYIADATATVSTPHIMLISRIMQEFDLKWFCEARADQITEMRARIMASAGCHRVMIGLESASTAISSQYLGGKSKEPTLQAVKILRDSDIEVQVFVLFGLPGETKESIKETLALLEEHELLASPNILWPVPGTPMWAIAKKKHLAWADLSKYNECLQEYNRRNRAFVPMPGMCEAPEEVLIEAVNWVWDHTAKLKGKRE